MATRNIKITNTWQKVGNGEAVVIQNRGLEYAEVATVKKGETPGAGFMLGNYEVFSYSGGDEVWVKCVRGSTNIIIDNVGI